MALYWWIDRWRKSSAYMDMTLEEQGAYRNLLDEAHLRGGPLPNDPRVLAKACGDATAWPRVQTVVMARFELQPDGWHNVTLDTVLGESLRRAEKQAKYRISKSGNGTGNVIGNGVLAPHRGNGNGNSNGVGNVRGNTDGSPSPSPSPSLISVSGTGTVSTVKRRRAR